MQITSQLQKPLPSFYSWVLKRLLSYVFGDAHPASEICTIAQFFGLLTVSAMSGQSSDAPNRLSI